MSSGVNDAGLKVANAARFSAVRGEVAVVLEGCEIKMGGWSGWLGRRVGWVWG